MICRQCHEEWIEAGIGTYDSPFCSDTCEERYNKELEHAIAGEDPEDA